MKNRNEIAAQDKWRLTDIYADETGFADDLAACRAGSEKLASCKGTLANGAEALRAAMDTLTEALFCLERANCYAYLCYSLDGGDAQAQEKMAKSQQTAVELMTAMAFLEPEVLEIPAAQMDAFLADERLRPYRHYLRDVMRSRAHTLDEAGEAILSQVSKITDTPQDVYNMFTNVEMTLPKIHDEDGNEAELTSGNFGAWRESGSRAVREEAFEGMFGTYRKYINTFAALYGGSVKKDNMLAAIRKHGSACEAALFGGNVPVSVYDSLIQAVHDALPSMQKYLNLRRQVLGLAHMDVYDLYCPMTADVSYPMPYADAKVLVKKALAPLGEEYAALLDRAFAENWVDVYETPGKISGAYSMGVYGVHPYVLLNYAGTLDDAFTLAHELGHAMHSYFSDREQDFANHDYKIMVAEVASTVNEVLLTKYLLATETDPRRRAYVLNHFLEGFRTTLFRQTLFAEFERIVHDKEQAGEPLTAEMLNRVYLELEKTYYSAAEMRDTIAVEWSYIPHFYRPFYVYQYATGFSSAVAIATGILESGSAENYLRFLTTGGSDYPLEELKIAGIDLTRPEVVANALRAFDEATNELAAVLA